MKNYFPLLFIAFLSFTITVNAQQKINTKKLDKQLEQSFQNFELNGLSVLILKDGELLFDKNYGTRDLKNPITSNSLYNIASVTKAFTGACMAKLVNEKKIKWEDLVIDYLPDFKLADPYITTHLTIADLLTHRSGMGTFYGDLLWYETERSNKDILYRMRYLPVTNRFRDQFGYQNNMYIVAAEILEKVTGQDWESYVSENILIPLGMLNTRTSGNKIGENQELAHPIINHKVVDITMKKPHAAASFFTSTSELSHWAEMLLNQGIYKGDTILNPAVVEDMMSGRTLRPVTGLKKMAGANFNTYALGWSVWDFHGIRILEHGGGMPGYISNLTLIPEYNMAFIILTNTLSSFPSALEYHLLAELMDDKSRDWLDLFMGFKTRGEAQEKAEEQQRLASRIEGTHPRLELKKYIGTYEDKMYGKAEITLVNEKLHLVFLPAKHLFYSDMEHWNNDTFKIKFADEFLPAGYIIFDFDSWNKILGFKIDLKSSDFHFFNLDFKKLD
ncbi:MAG: serine hydrolase [Bacteroidales bacterium]|nr:serine hydrolase [Bacteroidales bacterium]